MNNIKKKNILYKLDTKNTLPHSGDGDSIVFTSNSNITDNRVNNVLQQLINNDLYLENKIIHEMSYQAGPEYIQNIDQISALPNGSKRWVDSGDYTQPLQIYRKIEQPLSSSIYEIRNQAVKFIIPVGDIIFIAFTDKLMYDTGHGSLLDCVDQTNNTIAAIGYYTCTAGTFFITNTNLYELVQTVDNKYSLIKIDIGNVSNLRCVAYDSTDNMFYIGGQNSYIARGIYNKTNHKVNLVTDIKICKDDVYGQPYETNNYLNNVTINAIQLLDKTDTSVNKNNKQTDVLIATNIGIFRSDSRDYLNVNAFEVFNNKTCIDIVEYNRNIYALGSDGYLYKYINTNNTFQKYQEKIFQNPKQLIAHSSGIYIACKDGIYKYTKMDGTDPILEYSINDGIDTIDIESLNNENKIVFAAKNNIIYYYDNPSIIKNFSFLKDYKIIRLIAQPRKNKKYIFDVYVLTENINDNNTYAFAIYIEFKSNAEYDYDKIYSLSSIVDNCNSIATDSNNCYYAKGGTIYNLTTNYSKSLTGISNIFCINYSVDNNCIAIGTDNGLYILDPNTFEEKDSFSDIKNIKYITQSKNIVYFETDTELYAIPINIERNLDKNKNVLITDISKYSSYTKFNSVQTYNDNIYTVLNDSSGVGPILSTQPYYVRYATSASNINNSNIARPAHFPLMSAITEISLSSAIGLSAGIPYKLVYNPPSNEFSEITLSCIDTNTNIDQVKAICTAGKKLFIAAGQKIYQYEYPSDTEIFDPMDLSAMSAVISVDLPNVKKLIYSGTDTSFDMRIYAQTDNGLYAHKTKISTNRKTQNSYKYKDFIQYTDEIEVEENPGKYVSEYYYNFIGISEFQPNALVINKAFNYDLDKEWRSEEYSYPFNNISGEMPQTDRRPYAIFYSGNSRIYVAYTAKSNDNYIDCIAAITTDSIFNNEPDTTDFYILGNISENDHKNGQGKIRFSGFDIARLDSEIDEDLENEDFDIITLYNKDTKNKLLTFKIDTNTNKTLADVCNTTTEELDDLALSYFQPDCFYIKNTETYYIALPALTLDGDLQIELYKYNKNNTCQWNSRYYITNIDSSINIKDVFVIGSPIDNLKIVEFLIVANNNNAYTIKANSNVITDWSKSISILDKKEFKEIKRFSINQLIGYTDNLIYDFQSGCKFDYLESNFSINCVYLTNNGGSDDFIFIQQQSNNDIYASVIDLSIEFKKVNISQLNNNFLLTKCNNYLFIIDWINQKIYKETINGDFEIISEDKNIQFNTNYIDGCICYNDEIYYLCVLQSNNMINIYQIDITGQDKSILKVHTFENTSSNTGYIPFIIGSKNSGFNAYLRKQLFNNISIQYYNWPFICELNNTGNYNYLDFNSEFQLKFKGLNQGSINYLRIDKNNQYLYGVRKVNSKIAIESIINNINLLTGNKELVCDENSSNGWFSGKMYFFNSDNGIRYYNGTNWYTISNNKEKYTNIVNIDNNYYFLNDKQNLYTNINLKSFNLNVDPIYYEIEIDDDPIHIVKGNTYTGLISKNNINIQTLYILYPDAENIVTPSSINTTNYTNSIVYSVIAFEASFIGFPNNSSTNIYAIVPIGNFLKEIIIYDGNNLHIANVAEHQLIMDNNGISKIDIINTLPWAELNYTFEDVITASIKYNDIKYIASINGGLLSFSNKSVGLVMKTLNPSMKVMDINARSFYEIEKNHFYISTNNGIYRYIHIDDIPVVNRITPAIGYDIKQFISYNFTGLNDIYLIVNAFDNFIYQSENGRVWKKQFKPILTGNIETIYPQNIREWYFGGSTGLYKSIYQYTEVNDIEKFTENDLYLLYNELISSNISSSCDNLLIDHEISKSYMYGHINSLIDNINTNLLSVNFDGLQSNGWQQEHGTLTSDSYKIENDIVFEQYWGSNIDQNLTLSIENQFVTTSNAKFTYLMRRWMSGITEIYINIPTTNTYYINHLKSTPNYNIDENSIELTASNVSQFGKDKQIFRHDPNESGVYTTITLGINKSVFTIDSLIGVQACGNSLPLKIYRENINENCSNTDYEAAQYFNSYIAPTVMRSYTEDNDNYMFEFACFGSDEQVIKLEFIDTVNKFNEPYYRLVFNSNGLDANPDTFVKQRIRIDGQKYRLRRNQYQWPSDQKIFIGWTFSAYPSDNPDISKLNGFYNDADEISSTDIERLIGLVNQDEDIMIYAVWITYQFTEQDTVLLIQPSAEKNVFTIDNVETTNNTNIKDKVILQFEEIEF